MPKQRPTTRSERQAKNAATLPARFQPKFLTSTDQRQKVIKLIRKRLERLIDEAGCDSIQKELLANEAVFISVQLETMRVNALEGESFDANSYTCMVNSLSGLLNKLGLTKTHALTQKLTLAEIRQGKS